MKVCQLQPGQAFRVDDGYGQHHWDFRLIYSNDCRAYVEPLGRGMRQIRNAEGDVLAEIEDRTGRSNISPLTECELIDAKKEMTMPTNGEAVVKRGGDRYFPPKIQDRPVRPNTTRAKMLEYLKDDLLGAVKLSDVMAMFDMDRGLVVAHIHEMHKCHGYGYKITGDDVIIMEPAVDEAEDLL